ncbi:MAG: hypothetical protein CMG25_02925 [Candidatus Marinimicrobia bacterium]|nr:hypothetical protein [Candidatus Neomarinimicrobiota bacterium]|tara:strand:+ start:9772 stop:11121 length:1350 start_codon:yes stop_codon:yes gene_type:complete
MKFYKIFISFVVINILLGSSHKFNQPFIDVAESSNPSIVSIISEIEVRQRQFNPFFNDPFFQDLFPEFKRKGQTLGSGVIISSDGYIITNNHVIDDADKIKVIMYDKTEFEASVIGVDPLSDLAVIKIEADVVLPEITMGNSDKLSVGEWVVAIGSPFGLHLNHTVTAGIISATGRSNVISKLTYEDFIQHDAAINPGNSGGALLNLDGELVGINTAIATDGYSKSNAGVGFAIPINQAIRVIDDLLDDGSVSRGWLGVQIQNIDQAIADALNLENKDGALIVSIVPDSPASESGLQEDDIIIKVDSKDINNDRALMKAISSKRPGDFTNFTVIRGDEKLRISVTLGKRPDEVAVDEEKNIEQQSYDILGLKVIDNKDNDGVKVIDIKEGSSAYKNGIKKNDIIKKISRKKINNLSDYENQINQFNIGDVIMLRIERNGNQGIRAFTIE